VSVYVLRVDEEGNRIGLSLKRLKDNPWDKIDRVYQVGQLVVGQVSHLLQPVGAFVTLIPGIEAFLHISEMADPQPDDITLEEGQLLLARIISLEPKKQRLRLSLKGVAQSDYAQYLNTIGPLSNPRLHESLLLLREMKQIRDEIVHQRAEDFGPLMRVLHAITAEAIASVINESKLSDRPVDANDLVKLFEEYRDFIDDPLLGESQLPGDFEADVLDDPLEVNARDTIEDLPSIVKTDVGERLSPEPKDEDQFVQSLGQLQRVLENVAGWSQEEQDEVRNLIKESAIGQALRAELWQEQAELIRPIRYEWIEPVEIHAAFDTVVERKWPSREGKPGRRPVRLQRIRNVIQERENEDIPLDDFAEAFALAGKNSRSKNPRKEASNAISWLNCTFRDLNVDLQLEGRTTTTCGESTTVFHFRRLSTI
jgi:translation initiation factor 2 alpha subunit (eIF-2alpha)